MLCRLDDLDLDAQQHSWAMKLDVQGAERLVLECSRNLLPAVRLLEIEISIVELYEGQELLTEQLVFLEAVDFRLIWLERGFRDHDT
jgi:hypothetical protein